MSAKLDTGLLRHVGLTAFEANTIGVLMKTAGEMHWYPHSMKPETIERLKLMTQKGLIEKIDRAEGPYLRLTDLGRKAAAQIEQMNAAPKREIAAT